MKTIQRLALCFFAVMLLTALFASPVKADQLTYFTFSAPVELPGMTLPAGTYTFKVLDTAGTRNIVQVYNKDMTHLYGTFLTLADYRPQASDKSIVRFSETAQGGPPAVKEWFIPGDTDGFEFVYPKNRATQLAKASNQAVPSMASNMTPNITQSAGSSAAEQADKGAQQTNVTALKNTPVKAIQPNGDEVEVAEVFILTPGSTGEANTLHDVNTEYTTVAAKLPKTATLFPAVFLFGALLMMAGVLLRIISKPVA